MRFNKLKATLKTAVLVTTVLLLGAGLAAAQQRINLTAAPTTLTLPDGSSVPMWGYTCGTVATGSLATCAPLSKVTTGWSPVLITVPTTATGGLSINLTNNLTFTPTGSTTPNQIPTSLVIVGQLGGGLGTVGTSCTGGATCTASPVHENMGTTWPIANTGPVWVPPTQGPRIQSFGTEVAGGTTALLPAWSNLRPGTYLIESGTHPSIQGPMGLYGILVVTTVPAGATAGTAYPGVSYNAEIPLALSEIDPNQNRAVDAAVRTSEFNESATLGPYAAAPVASINLISGGSHYTTAPTVTFSAGAPTATATAVVDGDPTSSTYQQVTEIDIVNAGMYTEAPTITITGGGGSGASANAALQLTVSRSCMAGTTPAGACYPPAVNYTPLYYLINGQAFNKTSVASSLFPASPATGVAATGSVLVRMVNAGLRMHIPSIVGALTTPAVVPTGAPAATPVSGFSLVAEDGNPLPGVSRVQSEVFMAAGKTYDVMINVPAATATALPIFDRELSLSGNSIARDAGMLAYISVNGAVLPTLPAGLTTVQANPDTYNSVISGKTLTVSDPSKGVLANDINVYGVQVVGTAPAGLTLYRDGTFTYSGAPTSFTYCGNGATSGAACATVTLGAATIEAASGITCSVPTPTYTSTVATTLSIKPPGVLSFCKDAAGYPLTVNTATVAPASGLTLSVDPNGGFNATVSATGARTYTFTFQAQNSQGTSAASAATVTLSFPTPSNLAVNVIDGNDKVTKITDYRWIIEEDRTFYVDPTKTTNAGGTTIVPTFGTNFHTSYMPVIASGCTGDLSCESGQSVGGVKAVCDVGNGICRTTGTEQAIHLPSEVHLDPTKRYYITIFPGDAANPFANGFGGSPACTSSGGVSTPNPNCGHGMGGAPIGAGQTAVTILTQPSPYPPSKLSVFVFEDDFPLNGEQDGGGGIDVLSPNEPGLGGFNVTLFDDAGGTGDATGQMTYDMFNMPLSNSLAGTIDPATGNDACPISNLNVQTVGFDGTTSPTGITGTIVTCPKYESDRATLSPLAGQAVVANLMPGRYGVVATPAADRIARGEEWLQTNTLDGQKAHDSFLRIGEPSFFQEYGPAGYHVSIGFANPAIINGRKAAVCNGTDPNITGSNCTNSVTGTITTARMSRTPDERLYGSGDNSSFAFTQCYVSFGDPDGEDFAFTKCDANGNFTLSGLPDGDWRMTVFDQWNDMLVDGLSTPVRLAGGTALNVGQIATNQWQANIYTTTFFDANGNGVRDSNEEGLALVSTNNRFRDGSYSNFNNTDLDGYAGFNEIFPLFSWYVIETDTTRYKTTGVHVVYDAGGPADGTPCGTATTPPTAPCGNSTIASMLANTAEQIPVPAALRVPGARYCVSADCPTSDPGFDPSTATGSTGRVDPPFWFGSEGWQGFSGQNNFIEFGKKPYATGETGGIHGEVIYASTRPFDDPSLLIHTSWTPDVPGVTINLYQEGTAPDGSTALHLIDTMTTSSWDDWAQGFRSDGNPNMNCPGQGTNTGTAADLFFFTLYNQPMWLDIYNHGGTVTNPIPNNSQFKCYDGMHNWNQVQPAPYDGMYQFPSVTSFDPNTGVPAGSNCHMLTTAEPWGCVPNPDTTDPYRNGTPMLAAGKYVVEMVVPPGYELVKEEDKNILIGDNYIAPVTQQFAGLGNIFILPDQAEVDGAFNANNPQNATQTLGRPNSTYPQHEGDTGSVETFWPCVGASRVVPDFISLYPQSMEVSPFAGATRNLCDRKEVTLQPQSSALAKFWIFTPTHVAAHFTGVITDDYTSEFDPFSPQFGEKFSPPNLPISLKDWSGTEVSRVYADQWGTYDGLTYSTWEVNPPNPTGYAPTMMITCMNDPGTGPTPDPLFNPEYSQFCYEIPFMPGQTQYMDTPVVPTSAFAGAGYNNPDCSYPDGTPGIKEVDGDGIGPWVSAASGHTLTITSLGVQSVPNNGYSGPSATAAPFNAKTVTRNYGFGTTKGTVTIGGVSVTPANITTWNDSTIVVNVPSGVPACGIQQQLQYRGGGSTSNALCGQLVITRGDNGKSSIDTVTVTIGGKAPTHVLASASIQTAIDAARPGDLIIVDPTCTTTAGAVPCTTPGAVHSQSAHYEMVLMWKPVRLQGVGAASSIINANAHPAGKVQDWRTRVDCLFGLTPSGVPTGYSGSCGAGWSDFTPTGSNYPQIDRLPLEATVGWDASLNGNLAELLQEPTLMGALEGAAITVLSKGVLFPAGSNPFGADTFPAGTLLLTNGTSTSTGCGPNTTGAHNPHPSSFWCNPSSIDGLGITDSSQGGGGIFVHAWGHNLQIANNRVYNNAGTLSGGINVGQGEFPDAYLGGAANADPGSCDNNHPANVQLPYCFDEHVNVHHNSVSLNSSTGDELFSATPAGAGGVSFCTGTDYYQFNFNWVCGNLSSGDGGGLGQLGFVYNGDIEHNSFLFNQSTNPTIPTNGGAIVIMGAPDVDPTCGGTTDQDCVPAAGSVGPSNGTGPGLVINANLIMGNQAESGSGGGLRLQAINGVDVTTFPIDPTQWYQVTVTNNIIANNVAGWDGAGISLLDALNVNIINNTIMSNDSTASAGILFDTLGAPLASSGGTNCRTSATTSCPQPAGLVSVQNSTPLTTNLPATITCPAGHYAGTTASNGTCRYFSYPELYNDVFWQNRSFYIAVGALGSGGQNQQNVVALYNAFTTNQVTTEPQADATTPNGTGGGVIITGGTGACVPGSSYWDIGVRGDTGPSDHTGSGAANALAPAYSVLTDVADYSAAALHNTGANPTVFSQYCNGSRTPPEFLSMGWQVPPGIADATVPNPLFNLTPTATVDEGNNWINISWGPLAQTNTTVLGADGNYGGGAPLGNYAPAAGSPVIDYIPSTASTYAAAPSTDFFNNARKTNNSPVDAGAVEFQTVCAVPTLASIAPNTGLRGTAVPVTLTGTNLTGATAITVSGAGVTVSGLTVVSATTVRATFTISATATASARTVSITTPCGISNTVTFSVTAPAAPTLATISPTSGVRGTTVPVTLTGANLTGTTAVTVSGGGITVSAISVVDAAHVTANFAISNTAAITARNVSVTTPGGTSNTVTFTVIGPTLASIAPNTGFRGTAVPVTLTGTNLTGATAITVAGGGVTVSGLTVVNPTTVNATFTISLTATVSARNVSITTTPGGTSNNVTFTVQGPTLTAISPTSGARGTTVPVTITGTNLAGATAVTMSGGGVTCSVVTSTATSVNASCAITAGAATGARNVTVATPTLGNATLTGGFTVN
ncbi:MAG: hypothetical protein LAO56_19430 [Acidobacteriia bacterium]|nr:hypothetical protein [Terriglobia bacterium]